MTQSTTEQREKRMWYVVNPNTDLPTYAEGLRCNGDTWWFPTLGWSIPCTKLCLTEDAVRKMALALIEEQIAVLSRKANRIRTKGRIA